MRPSKAEQDQNRSPGAFLPDGSWNPEGQVVHRGELHRLVEQLCRERRFARLSPKEASLAIQASAHAVAFPSWRQWETCEHWAQAWCETSAEEAVKRAGETCAVEHHWCGAGKWLPGKQSSCREPSHDRPSPESAAQMLNSILSGMGG